MDFFGLPAQLEALSSSGAGDAWSTVTRAWYQRQRDTRQALVDCDAAQLLLGALPAEQAESAAARINLVRAEAAWLSDDAKRSQAWIDQAREQFQGLSDGIGVGDAWLCEASLLDQRGGDSLGAIRRAAAAYASGGDAVRIALADTWLACIQSAASPDQAAASWNASLERVRRLNHPGLDTFVEGALASQAYQSGNSAAAIEHFERSFNAALLVGQIFSAITVAQNLGIAYSALGDDEGALLWVQHARDLVLPTGWPYATNWCHVQSASILVGMGRAEAARELLIQSMPLLERFAASRNYALGTQILAEAALALGEPAEALNWSERSLQTAAQLNFPDLACGSLRFKAESLSKLNRPAEAMQAADSALLLAREHNDPRRECSLLHAMASIARAHNLPAPEGCGAASAALHYLRGAFEVSGRINGFKVPHEWHAQMSQDLQAIGDLASALEHQRLATAALEQTREHKALSLAVALQVRHRTETSRAEAEHQRSLARASQERMALLQASHDTLERLAAIAQDITRGLDANAVYASLARHAGSLLDAATIAVWRVDLADPTQLVLAWGLEDGSSLAAAVVSQDDIDSFTARCLRERRELLVEPAPEVLLSQTAPQTALRRSALFVPLVAGDDALGVLSIQSARAAAYGERERQILRSLGAATAVALANSTQAAQLALAQRELERQRMQGLLVHAGKMVAVGRLASGVVHEMSHPVGTLLLLAESMAEALQNQLPDAASSARDMHREAERLAMIVRRLRNFARADSAQLALHDIRAVLADARALYGPRLAMEHIACEEVIPALTVWADTERLSLAIANLVFNAADAMEGRDDKRIVITAQQRGELVALRVRDSGPGLSDEVAQRLFEPFFTTKPEGKGLGLGLAVSAESLAGMRARISGANAAEGGAEFTIELAAN